MSRPRRPRSPNSHLPAPFSPSIGSACSRSASPCVKVDWDASDTEKEMIHAPARDRPLYVCCSLACLQIERLTQRTLMQLRRYSLLIDHSTATGILSSVTRAMAHGNQRPPCWIPSTPTCHSPTPTEGRALHSPMALSLSPCHKLLDTWLAVLADPPTSSRYKGHGAQAPAAAPHLPTP